MANYLTTDSELISIADAIRTKGGTSEPLAYPSGFISAINSISAGIDLSAIAEPLKSEKHIYSEIVIDSPEAFEQALNIPIIDNFMISYIKSTVSIRFATNSTTKLASKSYISSYVYLNYPASISKNYITTFVYGYSTYLSMAYVLSYTTSSVRFVAYKMNIGTTSISLTSSYYSIYYSMFYSTSYDPYLYSNVATWYHGLDSRIYFQCIQSNKAVDSTAGMSSLYWGAASASILDFTSNAYYIPNYAFYRHKNLISVETANRVREIGTYAFRECTNISGSLNFPACSYVGTYAFYSCSKISEIYMNKVSLVDNYAFQYCGIQYLTSSNLGSCSQIGSYAFAGCQQLQTLSLPNVLTISNNAFYNCVKLISVDIPSVTIIPAGCFSNCYSLENINIPECTLIMSYAFCGCTRLSSLTLSKCSALDSYAFYKCSTLMDLYLLSTSVVSLSDASTIFGSTPIASDASTSGKIHVPSNLLSDYLADSVWTAYSDHLVGIE